VLFRVQVSIEKPRSVQHERSPVIGLPEFPALLDVQNRFPRGVREVVHPVLALFLHRLQQVGVEVLGKQASGGRLDGPERSQHGRCARGEERRDKAEWFVAGLKALYRRRTRQQRDVRGFDTEVKEILHCHACRLRS
jgi:hypothetical protein